MGKRKVNLYKWHRMKKKLISSVISVLCCLTVMAVGVFASTSHQFEVAVSNDISINIAVVDGTLSAKRSGGVYSAEKDGNGNFYISDPAKRGKVVDDSNNGFADFKVIYDKDNNKTADCTSLESERLDINVYNNYIEYVFKYEVEVNNGTATYIHLEDTSAWDAVNEKTPIAELSYKYIFADPTAEYSTIDWDEEDVQDFNFTFTGSNGVSNVISVGGNDIDAEQCVYIRCFIKYNTTEYGNLNYASSGAGVNGENGGDLTKLSMAYNGLWRFELLLSASATN